MLCRHPYVYNKFGKVVPFSSGGNDYTGVPFPCGQCLPCRINRRRIWTHRIMLEQLTCSASAYLTLTYADGNLPMTDDYRPTLCKRDVQLFLKRLRKRFKTHTIRYYCAGEYGGSFGRPHYHFCLFGISPEELETEIYERPKGVSRTLIAGHMRDWCINGEPIGNVYIGTLNEYSAQYVAGYVTKKLTGKRRDTVVLDPSDDPDALPVFLDVPADSRTQEFSLMSLKPAIGAKAIPLILDALKSDTGKRAFDFDVDDVPTALRHGKRLMPFGRYLVNKLREACGVDNESRLHRWLLELKLAEGDALKAGYHSLTDYLMAIDEQKEHILEKRYKIYDKRRKGYEKEIEI